MRYLFVAIAVFMGHLVMAQNEVTGDSKEGTAYLQGYADMGLAASIDQGGPYALRMNLLGGAGFNDWLFVGIGPGLRISRQVRSIPLFADFRIGNRIRESAFYGAVGGGISVGSRRSMAVIGPAGHAEIGVRLNKRQIGGTTIYLGYEIYTAEVVEYSVSGRNNYGRFDIVDIRAIVLGLGFSF